MVKSNLRSEDERLTRVINDLLDNKVYNKAPFSGPMRCSNRDEQKKGVDIRFKYNGVEHVCDEKAAVRYINKRLETFSFELSFIDRGGRVLDGWLVNPKEINDSFMLVWIGSADSDKPYSYTEIRDAEWMLITKESIIKYLADRGYTREKLIEKDDMIRFEGDKNFGDSRVNGFRFSFSTQLVEEPINVIIPRDQLRLIALAKGNISGKE